jgi:NAD-dependent dihydropyrimidine dehydrogenase PreA subunit
MPLRDQTTLQVVLYEGAGAEPLTAEARHAVLVGLLEKGFSVSVTRQDATAIKAQGALLVLGRFRNQPPQPTATEGGGRIVFRSLPAGELSQPAEIAETVRVEVGAIKPGDWKPWFPVIDYDRCTNCMQCLSFCLFGVYGVDAQNRIQAQNPDSCKTNCPACSRVCPEAAIIFPKYTASPINGDVVSDAEVQREKMKIDISALLGGDVHSLLRARSDRAKSRFSQERDADKALKERQKCLAKLIETGAIPPEVLMALPAPEEIQRRAEEAKARAKAALEKQARSGT